MPRHMNHGVIHPTGQMAAGSFGMRPVCTIDLPPPRQCRRMAGMCLGIGQKEVKNERPACTLGRGHIPAFRDELRKEPVCHSRGPDLESAQPHPAARAVQIGGISRAGRAYVTKPCRYRTQKCGDPGAQTGRGRACCIACLRGQDRLCPARMTAAAFGIRPHGSHPRVRGPWGQTSDDRCPDRVIASNLRAH